MSYAVLHCSHCNPYYDAELPRGKMIAAIAFDTIACLTLLVVGILAIIGGTLTLPLGGIGLIGMAGGGAMVAIGLLIPLIDIATKCCLTSGTTRADFEYTRKPPRGFATHRDAINAGYSLRR